MKKVFLGITTALLTVILCLAMTGCNKSGSIKKAFEKEDYTVTSVNSNDSTVQTILKPLLTEEQLEKIDEYDLLLCVGKGLSAITGSGVVIVFPSNGELKDFLTVEDADGNKDTSAYKSAKDDGRINGNCLYFGSSAGKEIFKKA